MYVVTIAVSTDELLLPATTLLYQCKSVQLIVTILIWSVELLIDN